jgi:hypothetical protein
MIGKTNNPQIARPFGFRTADSTVLPHVAGTPARMPMADLYITRPPATISLAQRQAEPGPAEKLPPGTYLQYVGFNQAGSVREYRFRRISRGEERKEFVVTADLSLFSKHHVGIQEGPALCLHVLLKQWAVSGVPLAPTPRSLTEPDMLAHLASRPAPKAKWGPKPVSHFSGAASESA